MPQTLAAVTLLAVLPLLAGGQLETPSAPSTPMSDRDVRRLMKTAHTSDQYRQLANYFEQEEVKYHEAAEAEKVERDRRAQVDAGVVQKYPHPVDSAEYWYESDVSKAESAAALANHFSILAALPK